jgi:L-lactate dehydrogenase complex protein LldE
MLTAGKWPDLERVWTGPELSGVGASAVQHLPKRSRAQAEVGLVAGDGFFYGTRNPLKAGGFHSPNARCRVISRLIRVMRITLFIPCFVDLLYPRVGMSMVRVLERLGHEVECPEGPGCCGQPAFNTGYWDESRALAVKVIEALKGAEAVVVASGSCGAMLRVFYPQLFAGRAEEKPAGELAAKTYEFSQFLVDKLGVTDVGAKFEAAVTFHDGCHGLRELGIKRAPRALMEKVQGLRLVEMDAAENCCGFGGTFSAKFPMISTAMGEVKCSSALQTKADYIASNDSSCLMHLQGLIDRQQLGVRTVHLAEILAGDVDR